MRLTGSGVDERPSYLYLLIQSAALILWIQAARIITVYSAAARPLGILVTGEPRNQTHP